MLDQARLLLAKAAAPALTAPGPPQRAPPGPPRFDASVPKCADLGKAVISALDALAAAHSAAGSASAAAALQQGAHQASGEETPGVSFTLRLLQRLLDVERLLRRAPGGGGGCGVAASPFLAWAFPKLLATKELQGTARQPLALLPSVMSVVESPSDTLLSAVRTLKVLTMPAGGAEAARRENKYKAYLAQRASLLAPAREAAASGRGATLSRYLGTILDVIRTDLSDPKEQASIRGTLADIANLAWRRDPSGGAYVAAATAADSSAAAGAAAGAAQATVDSAAFALQELGWAMLTAPGGERVQRSLPASELRAVGGAILVPLLRVAPRAAAVDFFTRHVARLHKIVSEAAPPHSGPTAPAAGGSDSPTTEAEAEAAAAKARKAAAAAAASEAVHEAAANLIRVMYNRVAPERLTAGPGASLPKMNAELTRALKKQVETATLGTREAAYAAFAALVRVTQDAADGAKRRHFMLVLDGKQLFGQQGWGLVVDCARPLKCALVLDLRLWNARQRAAAAAAAAAGGVGGGGSGGVSRKLALGSLVEAGSIADSLAGTPPEASPPTSSPGGGGAGTLSGTPPTRASGSLRNSATLPDDGDNGGGSRSGARRSGASGGRKSGAGDTAGDAAQEAQEEDEESGEGAQDLLDRSIVLQAVVRVLEHLAKVLSADIRSPETDCGTPPPWLAPVVRDVGDPFLHGNARLLLVKALLLLHRRAAPLPQGGQDVEGGEEVTEVQMSQTQMAETQDVSFSSPFGKSSPSGAGGAGGAGHRRPPSGAPDFSLPAVFAPALVAPMVDALIGNPERGGGRGLHVTLREFCIALLEWDSAWPPESDGAITTGASAGAAAGAAGAASMVVDLSGDDDEDMPAVDMGAMGDVPMDAADAAAEAAAELVPRPSGGYSRAHKEALAKLLWCECMPKLF